MRFTACIGIVVTTLIALFIFNTLLTAQVTIVKGRLLDFNGKPSKYAFAGTLPQDKQSTKHFVKCDKNGNYSIKLTHPGVNILLFSIPGHSSLTIPVKNDKDKEFSIDVMLAPYKYKDDFDGVGLMGNFNNFNFNPLEKMKKLDNGTYIQEVNTDKKDLWFQLVGIEKYGRSVNPPGYENYVPDSTGDYFAVVPVKDGKALIVFDPSKLLKSDTDHKVTFTGSKSDEDFFNIDRLTGKLFNAKYVHDEAEYKKIYTLLENDYSNNKEVKEFLKHFPKEIKIKVGVEIPDFEVASIDNPAEKFSKQSMLGKIYLIDFWGTWCGGCVHEMETLHKAYEKYKLKGFDIISLASDLNAERVIQFRKEKWAMPWKNSYIGTPDNGNSDNNIAFNFEVTGYPSPILVDADGKILAMETDLIGENLEKTLDKYFVNK